MSRIDTLDLRRAEWRLKPCPQCGAASGERCKRVSGYRKSVHRERRYAPEQTIQTEAGRSNPLLAPRRCNDRLDAVIVDAIRDIETFFRAQIRHFSARCESPIEELFAAASLLHREGARHLGVEMYHFGSDFDRERRKSSGDSTDVFPQAQIGQYRVDFLFDDLFREKRRFLVVELDGHDWHERTKQQAARDKSRDRALVSAGFRIMRFTGSEVYANPGECLQEVIEAILAARDDL